MQICTFECVYGLYV